LVQGLLPGWQGPLVQGLLQGWQELLVQGLLEPFEQKKNLLRPELPHFLLQIRQKDHEPGPEPPESQPSQKSKVKGQICAYAYKIENETRQKKSKNFKKGLFLSDFQKK
ncbi:MAG: hypothetical protein MJY99_12705, partial [Fibrobacter sp.]|nr:hypothetical protein [Fibrobacter sp.]